MFFLVLNVSHVIAFSHLVLSNLNTALQLKYSLLKADILFTVFHWQYDEIVDVNRRGTIQSLLCQSLLVCFDKAC